MEVEWLQKGIIYFGDLDIGDTFVVDHIPYIKIDQDGCRSVNAVSLRNGDMVTFENNDYVEETKFKLVEI